MLFLAIICLDLTTFYCMTFKPSCNIFNPRLCVKVNVHLILCEGFLFHFCILQFYANYFQASAVICFSVIFHNFIYLSCLDIDIFIIEIFSSKNIDLQKRLCDIDVENQIEFLTNVVLLFN